VPTYEERPGSGPVIESVLMVMFVLLVNAYFQKPWLDSFLFAVALAVGLTPELLPMVISVTLSRGAMRMAKILGYQVATNTTVYKETEVQEIEQMFECQHHLSGRPRGDPGGGGLDGVARLCA